MQTLSSDVLVDGSDPGPLEALGALGALSLPRTAVGAADGPADAEAFDGGPDGAGEPAGGAAADADADATAVDGAVVTAGDTVVGDAFELASGETGLRAIDPVDDAATTAAPTASSAASATIGRIAKRLPSGRRSRQFGQNPETGVVT